MAWSLLVNNIIKKWRVNIKYSHLKKSISVVHVLISLTYSFHNVYLFQNMLYMIDIKFYLFFKIIKNNVSENIGIHKDFNINT